jgi:large subunit ribosomal protein L2
MAIKKYMPTSPGRRGQSTIYDPELSKDRPEKSLLKKRTSKGGRNNNGRITVRFRGGGVKRKYREIDFRRDKFDVPAKVARLEYDPNRTVRIALLHYMDGEKRYVLAPVGLKVGDRVLSAANTDVKPGNSMPLSNIPQGTLVHNVEMKIGKGGQIVRSAGTSAQLMAKEGEYVTLKLPSGEFRKFHKNCRASIGQLGNTDNENVVLGKAGRRRWMGFRPHVRGVAMNPVDHPHGGGEGKTSGGRHPVSPWGKSTKGVRTRKNKRTNKFIVRTRRRSKK